MEKTVKASHTPGPWNCGPSINAPGQFYIGQSKNMLTLAHVHNFPNEMEANAALIAAAPDLLAVLRTVLDCYAAAMLALKQTPDNFHSSREVVAAKAAIARAEGGTP